MTRVQDPQANGAVVALTPAAVRQVRFRMERQGKAGHCLRLGVRGGGCSGYSYTMAFVEEPTGRDTTYLVDDLRVVVDPKSARLLAGATLDYSLSNLLEGGWTWTNPLAARTCGCGTSFAAE
ncbi:MAG: iron-sulfur cluster assembly accessory protein [Chthonomonadales bacterium]|nr:iron-sulfur cluster assembly accessory protein [Chthonomonadales bacterium]